MFWFVKRVNPTKIPMWYIHEWHYGKAGQFVGKADCCAVAAIADNATFLLAANRMAVFRSQSQNQQHCPLDNICCCSSTGRPSASEASSCGFESHLGQYFFTCLYPPRHMRSVQSYPISVSTERETPIPHSLTLWYAVVLVLKSSAIPRTNLISLAVFSIETVKPFINKSKWYISI